MATQTQYYNLDKPSYDEVADIEILNANMDKIDQQMRNNADGVNFAKCISSDAYNNSKSYAVGDYCIYDNKLYRCITAIESAEAFNVEKWEQTTVGKEVNQLSSNLADLKVNDVAGGKNLLKITREDENGWSYSDKCYYNGTYTMSSNNPEVSTAYIVDGWHYLPYTFTCDGTYNFAFQTSMSISSKCIQLEEGTQATDYEPYIPSVKMLAEEVSAQNESLSDLENAINGLNDDNYWEQGTWNILGQKVDEPTIIRMKEKLILPIDYSVSLVNSNYVYEVDYYENGTYKNDTGWISGLTIIPKGQEFVLLIRKVDTSDLVPTERNAISVLPKNIGTINDKLKNDLESKVNFDRILYANVSCESDQWTVLDNSVNWYQLNFIPILKSAYQASNGNQAGGLLRINANTGAIEFKPDVYCDWVLVYLLKV